MPRPKQSEIVNLLRPNPDIDLKANDAIPKNQSEPDIGDKDVLSEYLQKITKQDIADRDSWGFIDKQTYNEKSYYGIKDEFFSNWPWPRASNFIEPITPTLVDVGITQMQSALFRNPMNTVNVEGVSKEDKLYAPLVQHVMNYTNGVETEIHDVQGTNLFRILLRGTGFMKSWLDIGDEFKLRHASIPMQLVYKPIRGNGCQRDKCDHISQFIPLTENDWMFRRGIKIKGKDVYENLDLIAPGFEPASDSLGGEELQLLKNQITGMDIQTADARDLRWMVETQLTYYPPEKFKAVELIVWWSLRAGIIHRVVEVDPSIKRSLADYWVYPSDGYSYQRSLPEIIRDIHEKANYTDKQVTDASDGAIMPPGFIEEGSGFDPMEHVLVPNGMYEVKRGTNIQWKQVNITPIIERSREIDKLWDKAKTRTGFTDIFMGLEPDRQNTLGGDRLRLAKANNRFKGLLDTFNIGYRRSCEIQYDLIDRNIPRKKLVMILGSMDYSNANQLFPNVQDGGQEFGLGIDAKLNFSISGKSQEEVDIKNQDILTMTQEILATPFGQDKGVAWRCLKARSEVRGYKEYETVVPRPPEADIQSIDEVLQRIESGETQIEPSPIMENVQIEFYLFRIGAFTKTERFRFYNEKQKAALKLYANRLNQIREGQEIAKWQKRAESDPLVAEAMGEFMQEVGRGDMSGGRTEIPTGGMNGRSTPIV